MKKLIVLLVLLPMLGSAQTKDTIPKHNRTSGDELRLAGKRGGLGVVMIFGGSAVIALSQGSSDVNTTLVVLGGAIGIIGFVMIMKGWSHVSKAGKKLNSNSLSLGVGGNGISLCYRL